MRNRVSILKGVRSWREQYNPLRGLDIAQAVRLIEAGMRGEYAELQWAYEFIEQADADLLALVERRLSAISELDWDIKQRGQDDAQFDSAMADDQAEALRAAYERIDNMTEAFDHLALASFRGFSIIQPHTDGSGRAAHLECLNHWNFVRDGRDGGWGWNPQAKNCSYKSIPEGDRLDAEAFMIRTVRRPIDRIAIVKFVRANLSEKDWDDYIECYGIPAVFITMPENVPEEKRESYREEAEAAGEGGGGALPYGATVTTPPVDRGVQPFSLRLDHLSRKLVLAGTGGMLTMLTESGSGTLAGGAHTETFRSLARAEAKRISELFQQKFDAAVLAAEFPNRPRLAYFELASEESVDVGEMVSHFSLLRAAGLAIDPEQASEKTGYKLTVADPIGATPLLNRSLNRDSKTTQAADQAQTALAENSREELAKAIGQDLEPLRKRIEAALALDDEAMMSSLQDLITELPAMLADITKAPAAQTVIENIMAAALANGLEEGMQQRRMK
ncbi:MAG: DUF935 family protein [Kiritimatiellia bacterium]